MIIIISASFHPPHLFRTVFRQKPLPLCGWLGCSAALLNCKANLNYIFPRIALLERTWRCMVGSWPDGGAGGLR